MSSSSCQNDALNQMLNTAQDGAVSRRKERAVAVYTSAGPQASRGSPQREIRSSSRPAPSPRGPSRTRGSGSDRAQPSALEAVRISPCCKCGLPFIGWL